MSKKFSIISLGCFRNTYDSEVLAHEFSQDKYILSDLDDLCKKGNKCCDLLIVNTCGFIDKAKEESLDVISQAVDLKKKNKVSKIIVLGCLVKRYKSELEKSFPEVDQWLSIVEFENTFKKRKRLQPKFVDFLKVCEGCLNRCSFCSIPIIKGSLHSRPLAQVVKEAKYLDTRGVKELNIIGQDITSWGKDLKTKPDLTKLVKAVLKNTKNIRWIRLIYSHPRNFSNSLIDLIANEERICKYIDLPIQHINDRILKAMNRHTSRRDIESLIKKIRKKIPGCSLRTSVIVGFPGETKKEFQELLDFIDQTRFQHLGAFLYSREEGTGAYGLAPQVHYKTKESRLNQVMSLQQQIVQELNSKLIGSEQEVLIEAKENNYYIGRNQFNAPEVDGVVIVKKKKLKVGSFYKVKIIDSNVYDLVAV
jgi:ribosomal protein S12 methylthiotransferase